MNSDRWFPKTIMLLNNLKHACFRICLKYGGLVIATASDVLTQSMVQLSVPNHLRGRAMGAWTLAIGSAPLGHLEMGALIVWLGLGGALMTNGAALIIVALLTTVLVPRLRKL